MTSRRAFISLAASAGAAAALPRPALADDPPTCTAIAAHAPTTATPVPWTRPSDTVVAPRLAAWELAPEQIAKLRTAYTRMRALPDSDGRSLAGQRNMHAYFCNGDAFEIHGHWTFLPWHRMFLHFHERILGSLVGDMSLRLPYWDWENPQHQAPPPAYAEPQYNSLFDATRPLKSGQSVQRVLKNRKTGKLRYYQLALVHNLFDCSFDQFGGTATAGGVVEAGSHGYVHVSAGGDATRYDALSCSGDLAILNTAALDPLFFAHHANLDRLWNSWETYGGNHNPQDGAFGSLAFTFFDEHGTWVEMTVAQMANVEQQLGYHYDRKIAPMVMGAPGPAQRVTLQQNGRPAPLAIGPAAAAQAKHPELVLTNLVVPGEGDFQLSVVSARGTKALGDFFIVPHGHVAGAMPMAPRAQTFNVCVALPPDSVSILLGGNRQFYLQPSSAPVARLQGARAPAPARIGKVELLLK